MSAKVTKFINPGPSSYLQIYESPFFSKPSFQSHAVSIGSAYNWSLISKVYAEEFSKLMEPSYARSLPNHSGAGTKGRENEKQVKGNIFAPLEGVPECTILNERGPEV